MIEFNKEQQELLLEMAKRFFSDKYRHIKIKEGWWGNPPRLAFYKLESKIARWFEGDEDGIKKISFRDFISDMLPEVWTYFTKRTRDIETIDSTYSNLVTLLRKSPNSLLDYFKGEIVKIDLKTKKKLGKENTELKKEIFTMVTGASLQEETGPAYESLDTFIELDEVFIKNLPPIYKEAIIKQAMIINK